MWETLKFINILTVKITKIYKIKFFSIHKN